MTRVASMSYSPDRVLICDTSGLLARYDPDDVAHPTAVATFDHATPPFLVSPPVLVEFDYLLRTRHPLAAAREVLADVAGSGYEHPHLDATALHSCLDLDARYGDLNLGLADASVVVLAQRYRTCDILTLDYRHFRAITPLQGGAFHLPLLDL